MEITFIGLIAVSADGNFEKFMMPDSSGSYVRVRPEYAGMPANTDSGMYSIYLPYAEVVGVPAKLAAEARAFSKACDAAEANIKAAAKLAELLESNAAVAAEASRREGLKIEAAQTGTKMLVRKYVTACDGSAYECDQDFVAEWIDGQGTITRTRSHAH